MAVAQSLLLLLPSVPVDLFYTVRSDERKLDPGTTAHRRWREREKSAISTGKIPGALCSPGRGAATRSLVTTPDLTVSIVRVTSPSENIGREPLGVRVPLRDFSHENVPSPVTRDSLN